MSTLALLAAVKGSDLLGDLFKAGSDLANLGILGILAVAVLALTWFAWQSYRREVQRADKAEMLAGTLSSQFDRALDVMERQASRRRNGDVR